MLPDKNIKWLQPLEQISIKNITNVFQIIEIKKNTFYMSNIYLHVRYLFTCHILIITFFIVLNSKIYELQWFV